MILGKKLYLERFKLVGGFKTLTTFLFQKRSLHKEDDIDSREEGQKEGQKEASTPRGRPKLMTRSKVVVGDWMACEKVCPTDCLEVEVKSDKLISMNLNMLRCIGCGDCIKVSPESSLELEEFEVISDFSQLSRLKKINLIKERDHLAS